MSDRIRPHMYFVMTVNVATKLSYVAGFGVSHPEPMTYDIAETRLAKLAPKEGFEDSLISLEEFNRRFERKG